MLTCRSLKTLNDVQTDERNFDVTMVANKGLAICMIFFFFGGGGG